MMTNDSDGKAACRVARWYFVLRQYLVLHQILIKIDTDNSHDNNDKIIIGKLRTLIMIMSDSTNTDNSDDNNENSNSDKNDNDAK